MIGTMLEVLPKQYFNKEDKSNIYSNCNHLDRSKDWMHQNCNKKVF